MVHLFRAKQFIHEQSVGSLVSGAAYDLYGACESMKDLDKRYAGMARDEEEPDHVVREVVGLVLVFYDWAQHEECWVQ